MKTIYINIGRHATNIQYGMQRWYDCLTKKHNIWIRHIDFIKHEIQTKHFIVRFICELSDLRGHRADEAFGFDEGDTKMLLGKRYPDRYTGRAIDYVLECELHEDYICE